jgi:uncharacterized protein YhaN
MQISGFHLDGYGALSDFGIDSVDPGLVVLFGPNEAGKSTLMDFLTGTLFGIPSRRADPRHRTPTGGARHGGRVWLTETAGSDRTWVIERYGPPRKELRVRRPDGSEATEDDLRRALGGADDALYRAVFAVDLTELGSAEALGRDNVRELLFSASILGQRRSASRAMEELNKQRAEIARPRQADARINRLLPALEDVRRRLVEANRAATAYPQREAEARRLEAQVDEARSDAAADERRARELELLLRLWNIVEQGREAELALATSSEPSPTATWLEDNAPTIRSLHGECSGYLERLARMNELTGQRESIDQSIDRALGKLGTGWDRTRLRSTSGWIALTDEAREFRDAISTSEADGRAQGVLVREASTALELLPPNDAPTASPPIAAAGEIAPDRYAPVDAAASPDVDQRRAQLYELRQNLGEAAKLAAERRIAAIDSGRSGRGAGPPATRLTLAVLGAVAVGLCVGAFLAAGRPVLLALCVGLAAVAAISFIVVLSTARRATGPTDAATGPGSEDALDQVSDRVRRLAVALGLPPAPSASDVDVAMMRVDEERDRVRSKRDETIRRSEALRRLEAAGAALQAADAELESQLGRFVDWKHQKGFDEGLTPEGVLESIAELGQASEYLAALRRVEDDLAARRAELDVFDRTMAELAASHPDPDLRESLSCDDPSGTLDSLSGQLDEASAQRAERERLERALAAATAEVDRSLGTGVEADRLRAELQRGEVLEWQTEYAQRERSRVDKAELIETLVRGHQDVLRDLAEIAGSDEIAEIELARSALEEELEGALREWTLLGCARLLLERTLRRHEQERQPAVLARAGERFSKVTDGRYVKLLPSLGDEGPAQSIRVVSASGSEMEAASLSRGTLEQLYLCLRLGLAETFAERAVPLPLLLDDVLVNFDAARAAAVVGALAETADSHQVLLFTCHPHLVELVVGVVPETQVIELARL